MKTFSESINECGKQRYYNANVFKLDYVFNREVQLSVKTSPTACDKIVAFSQPINECGKVKLLQFQCVQIRLSFYLRGACHTDLITVF